MKLKFWEKDIEETVTADGFVKDERIEVKTTSKLGYFFLIIMVITGISFGQMLLDGIKNSFPKPESLSYCYDHYSVRLVVNKNNYQSSYNYYDDYNGSNDSRCNRISKIENSVGMTEIYKELKVKDEIRKELATEINNIDKVINDKKQKSYTNQNNYNTSLLEDIAKTTNDVYSPNKIANTLNSDNKNIKELELNIADLKDKYNKADQDLTDAVMSHKTAFDNVQSAYTHAVNVYMFEQFLVALILILPLFLIVWKMYHRSKNIGSQFAIIWGGAVAVTSLLMTQLLLAFIYEVIPRKLITALFALFTGIEFILYWLGFILIPGFFGLLIYIIQKKYYNKEAVTMRSVKAGICPACEMKIHRSMNNCPICSFKLRDTCISCKYSTSIIGKYCENCGAKKNVLIP